MLVDPTGLAGVSVGVGRLAVELERGERTLICDASAVAVVRRGDAFACKEHLAMGREVSVLIKRRLF